MDENDAELTSGQVCPPIADDRRAAERRSLLRQAGLHRVGNIADIRVSDVSHSGLHGVTSMLLAVRQRVHVSFDGVRFFPSDIRWRNGDEYGLETMSPLIFPMGGGPIEVAEDNGQDRAMRLAVDIRARVATSLPPQSVRVRNISEGGAMVEGAIEPDEDEQVLLDIGGAALLGRIRWRLEDRAGVRFERDIDVDEFLRTTRS
jgi:hypothetical protein